MTTPRPIYDGSQYEFGYSKGHPTVIRDRGPGFSVQNFYAYADHMRTQLETPKRMHSMRDASNNTVQVSTTIHQLSTRIPFPINAIQSRRRHTNLVESNGLRLRELQWKPRMSYAAPLGIMGLTDRDLLPSQRERVQHLALGSLFVNRKKTALGRATTQVQPSSNPFHWVVTADRKDTSSWVNILRVRSDDMVRQRAGTLKRNTAVRRSRKELTVSPAGSTANKMYATSASTAKRTVFRHDHVLSKHKMRRSFSFEYEGPDTNLSTTREQAKQRDASKSISVTHVDWGIEQVTQGRSTRFREELDQPPPVARTFSEILGYESFIPTALLYSN